MGVKELVLKYNVVGIISNYESTFKFDGLVKDLKINNLENALKMVNLDNSILDKKMSGLSLNELWKLELASKLNNNIIVVGNLSKFLNYKDILYFQKLFIKLVEYNKKIVIIDNDVKVFFNLVKKIIVLENNKIAYITDNFYDDNLYKYTRMPKIIEFIKYVNSEDDILNETLDIYELIKDIYRRVS